MKVVLLRILLPNTPQLIMHIRKPRRIFIRYHLFFVTEFAQHEEEGLLEGGEGSGGEGHAGDCSQV